MQIKQEYIERAEVLLLPEGCHFDEERIRFIGKMDSGDLLAVPGSGKTTALRAKLYCMSQNLPLSDERGILVISHTNVAVEELRHILKSHCPQLFEYPNFVGTIQDFVDTFLALPYYVQMYNHKVDIIDAERYAEACVRYMSKPGAESAYLSGKLQYGNDYKQIRFGVDENGDVYLRQGVNGNKVEIPIADKWRKEGKVAERAAKMEKFLFRMKDSIMKYGILHFDDCYYLAERYIKEYPEIINVIRNRFAYVFVDEAQDMQDHQLSIIDECFNCDSVVLQRIGDPNQSIFDGFSVDNTWVARNPSYINNSLRLSPEVASVVDHLMIDRGNDEDGRERFVVNGVNVLDDPIKPYLLLYTWETKNKLKNKFREIIQQYNLHLTQDGKKYGFHIIGWNAEKSNNINFRHLEDIFPEFNRNLQHFNNVPETLSEIIQQDKNNGSFAESRNSILESFVAVLRKADIKSNDNRQYNKSKLLYMISEKDDTTQAKFYEDLLLGTKTLSTGQWSGAYLEIKRLLVKWLHDFFAKDVDDKVGDFLGDAFVPLTENVEVQNAEDNEIPLTVGTVHSAKGMTHCATMYVETSYRNKYESQYVTEVKTTGRVPNKVTTITSALLKHDIEVNGKIAAMAKRMLYVGFSRPTHLLCYASEKSLWSDELLGMMNKAGWIIEDIGK